VNTPDVRRLFLALWPDSAVRNALVELQRSLPSGIGRLVSGDNLHLTLIFLGSTPAERQRCIEEALTGIAATGFSLQLDRLGYWRKPQVLWAGSAVTPPPLSALVRETQDCVVRCGGAVDERPFQIHLTLCRKVRKAPRDLPAVAPISWPVRAFALVESVTAAAGVQYRVLREWPLAAGTDGGTSQ